MGDFGNGLGDPGIPPGGDYSQPNISFLVWIMNQIIYALKFIWGWFVWLYNALVIIFSKLKNLLLHLWQKVISKAIVWLAQETQKLRAWLKRVLNPILKRLQKIKKWYDEHILKQQLRMIQLIQRVRRVLALLRIFHVGWAAKLDNMLADVQNRIEKSIAITRGILNQIINTLTLVLDPELLVMRNILGGTLLKNLGAVKRIFGYGDNRIASAAEVATLEHDHARDFQATTYAHMQALVTTGPTDDDKTLRATAMQALADATNTTIGGKQPS